jgi:CheY-like chemotaxis protein
MSEPRRILLVDDDLQVVKFLKKALETNGYSVQATTSGKEALVLLRQQPPDLMILDLNMPEVDGFDLLKIERTEFPYLRILVISGYLKGALLDAAKFVGATATLEKPVTAEALVAKVRDMIGR